MVEDIQVSEDVEELYQKVVNQNRKLQELIQQERQQIIKNKSYHKQYCKEYYQKNKGKK